LTKPDPNVHPAKVATMAAIAVRTAIRPRRQFKACTFDSFNTALV
jgi:hypothetical protein